MPAPYGNFTKSTWDFKQPNNNALDLFVVQLVTDAVKASNIAIVKASYVTPFYRYPSEQELTANKIDTNCIITVAHDQDTQGLYPDNSIRLSKKLSQWDRPYVINATIVDKNTNKNNPVNSEVIYLIEKELIDLLCFNDGEYTNNGSTTETFKNRPLHNTLLENRVFHEDTSNRPNHYFVSLTILFRIYK